MLPEKLRYAGVGLVCAGAHNAIMIGGTWLHIHFALLLMASYGFVVVLGYLLHSAFTFAEATSRIGFGRYALAMVTNFPLSLLLTALLFGGLGWPMLLVSPLTTVLLFALNYLLSRWAILGRRAPSTPF